MGANQVTEAAGRGGKHGEGSGNGGNAPPMMRLGARFRRSETIRGLVDRHYSRKEGRKGWKKARAILGGRVEAKKVEGGLGTVDKGGAYMKLNGAADAFVRAAKFFEKGNRKGTASEMLEAAAEGLLEAVEEGMVLDCVDECYRRASNLFAAAARLRKGERGDALWVRAEEVALGIGRELLARKHCGERGADEKITELKLSAYAMSGKLAEAVEVSADIARGAMGKGERGEEDSAEAYAGLAEKLMEIAELAWGGERREYDFRAALAYRKASEKLGGEPKEAALRERKKEYEGKRKECMERAGAVYNAYGEDVSALVYWHPL